MAKNLKEDHRHFHSLCINPHIVFGDKLAGEKVILILRAHPITQIPWIINTFFLTIIALFLNIFFVHFFSLARILFLNIAMMIVIFNYTWINFLKWFFNVGVITNKRIIDVDFHSILVKETSGTTVDKVEDINASITGYFASFFNYGDVVVQTAGEEENIEFASVPEPSRVVSIINSVVKKEENE